MFILASVRWSIQCLISAVTQVGGGDLFFRFTFSVVLWGGRGAADKYDWPVWGALAVFRPHWVCPAHGLCAFPVTLLRVQAALLGAGPELRALPRPKPLRFRFSGTPQRCRLRWACVLCLPGLSSSGRQELDECTCSRCRVPYPLRGPSLSFQLVQCSSCLSWGADLCLRPSRQMSTIQNLRKCLVRNWKPVCSLVGDSVSGAELPLSGSGWSLVLLSSCKWPAVP